MSALTEFTKEHAPLIEEVMERFVKEHTSDQRLFKSMQYSIQAGKRIRPLLLAQQSPPQTRQYRGVPVSRDPRNGAYVFADP